MKDFNPLFNFTDEKYSLKVIHLYVPTHILRNDKGNGPSIGVDDMYLRLDVLKSHGYDCFLHLENITGANFIFLKSVTENLTYEVIGENKDFKVRSVKC